MRATCAMRASAPGWSAAGTSDSVRTATAKAWPSECSTTPDLVAEVEQGAGLGGPGRGVGAEVRGEPVPEEVVGHEAAYPLGHLRVDRRRGPQGLEQVDVGARAAGVGAGGVELRAPGGRGRWSRRRWRGRGRDRPGWRRSVPRGCRTARACVWRTVMSRRPNSWRRSATRAGGVRPNSASAAVPSLSRCSDRAGRRPRSGRGGGSGSVRWGPVW